LTLAMESQHKPLGQRKVRIVKDRAASGAELLTAG
jgi:hypothetical protein